MSTVAEIEAAIQRLPELQVEELAAWLEKFRTDRAVPSVVYRPIGWMKGKWELPDSFFDPLPDDLLNLFEGKTESGE